MKFFSFFIFLIAICDWSVASPVAGHGSSILADKDQGYFLSSLGFTFKTVGTHWSLETVANDPSAQTPRLVYRDDASALMSVHLDKLPNELSLETYIKRWIRDYNHYGFDVLGSKAFTLGDNKKVRFTRGFVVDLVHKKMSRQMRQVIFLKEKNVVIVTCQNKKDQFSQTLTDCNQIAKTFEWTDVKINPLSALTK
jgi:hypothetical protein